ncbi:MAG TPA: hypothetical protein VME67_06785 [Mycobacterium sp.]|nr:hypothetical protein [Mycobacterium sp.]HTX94565.1 hypothetical protein [Mycobacterium sp.]
MRPLGANNETGWSKFCLNTVTGNGGHRPPAAVFCGIIAPGLTLFLLAFVAAGEGWISAQRRLNGGENILR